MPLKVAIIGGGPGGLGAAISLSKLPFVSWTLYEKKTAISETGGGITLQMNTLRMLKALGVAKNIKEDDIFRSPESIVAQLRNGRTGILLQEAIHPGDVPKDLTSCRMRRAKLQSALLKEVDQSRTRPSKKLVGVEKRADGKLLIQFEDGFEDVVDLLIGADGIRSVVRSIVFPSKSMKYSGQYSYRTIISKARVLSTIPNIPKAEVFWQNVGPKNVYTCPLGGDAFEVTVRIGRPAENRVHVSWGQVFDFGDLLGEYADFCEPVQKILRLAAEEQGEGKTQEFAHFSGPRLESIVAFDALALLGDASHPLSGAFGAGSGFALEDSYALARSLEFAWSKGGWEMDKPRLTKTALELYDKIRSPHYARLYAELDERARVAVEVAKKGLLVDDQIAELGKALKDRRPTWMYSYEVDKAVDEALKNTPATTAAA